MPPGRDWKVPREDVEEERWYTRTVLHMLRDDLKVRICWKMAEPHGLTRVGRWQSDMGRHTPLHDLGDPAAPKLHCIMCPLFVRVCS